MSNRNISIGKNVLKIEGEAVLNLVDRIDENFDEGINAIRNCVGRVIVTGMGKSGLISQKIAATLSSTGTPSLFMHPGEASHGDLGMVTKEDIILAISNSGETYELIQIIPAFKRMGLTIIAMIGRQNSTLTKLVDIYIDTSVEQEADTLELAPTASTTATLAMGDALAIALLENRGFKAEDFALLHPGGTLGKRLLLTVGEIMHSGDEIPLVSEESPVSEALLKMTEKGFGVTGVLDSAKKLTGIITDGDIRRGMEKSGNQIFEQTAAFLQSKNFKWVEKSTLAINALEVMEDHNITSLFVFEDKIKNTPDGLIHIHDILKTGIL
ncbi:MAG: D-arabinose 5-phosphate isomerase [Candidatus Marinimicrobia bacterium]|jgi:arabinose-5-phosphate isomerase|nr:D-arabinose 5-phosphate isomerase [Candidatus Neomarinimicrobiota bacterium]